MRLAAFNKTATVLLSSVLFAHYALAATVATISLAGFEPNPVVASELGVGDGETTWLISPGPLATATSGDFALNAPATLVVGASNAEIIYADHSQGVSLNENCKINNGVEVCTAKIDVASNSDHPGYTTTQVFTATASYFTLAVASSTHTSGALAKAEPFALLSFVIGGVALYML